MVISSLKISGIEIHHLNKINIVKKEVQSTYLQVYEFIQIPSVEMINTE